MDKAEYIRRLAESNGVPQPRVVVTSGEEVTLACTHPPGKKTSLREVWRFADGLLDLTTRTIYLAPWASTRTAAHEFKHYMDMVRYGADYVRAVGELRAQRFAYENAPSAAGLLALCVPAAISATLIFLGLRYK